MKSRKVIIFIGILLLLTAFAAVIHLSTRENIPKHTIQVTKGEDVYTVDIMELEYETVSGVRRNGKGEEIPIKGDAIAMRTLREHLKITDFSTVTIVADDSYNANVTKEEIEKKDKVYLFLEEDTLRLVVFEDENSKRSVSHVVQICVE